MVNRILWSVAFVVFMLAPPIAAADFTVDDVTLASGWDIYQGAALGWQLPVKLGAGESVILTQTPRFNFDLPPTSMPVVLVTIDGTQRPIFDRNRVLFGRPVGNRGVEWELVYRVGNIDVWVSYADNWTPAPCVLLECFPLDFFAPTYFQGESTFREPGTEALPANICRWGAPTCWRAPAIRITNTDIPDPNTPHEH
jgi:hypothetical protein